MRTASEAAPILTQFVTHRRGKRILTAALVCAATLLALALFQTLVAFKFFRLFPRKLDPPVWASASGDWPPAAILLPLRGADPRLSDTLDSLLRLDYPRYELQIVLDSDTDPAAGLVREALRTHGVIPGQTWSNPAGGKLVVHVDAVQNRLKTCSPQCCAFYEAVQRLADESEVICTIDGDVVAHPLWLRQLVAPLSDEHVGVAHGNRWYLPPDHRPGSLVRYLWNAAAVVPMCFLGMPWAGSMAIRRRVLEDSGLLENWKWAIVPDAPTKSMVDQSGQRVQFVPELIMTNRETCDLAFSLDFLKRQMMWTRLYNPNWWVVVLHACLTTAATGAAAGFAVWLLATSNWAAAAVFVGAVSGYVLSLMLLLVLMEIHVRRPIERRGEKLPPFFPGARLFWVAATIPLTQVLYMAAVLLAHFGRQVTWRGIRYRIHSPWNIEMVDDRPFVQSSAGDNASL